MAHQAVRFPSTNHNPNGNKADRFNQVRFEPVTTAAIRLKAKTKPGFSSGILEWRVLSNGTNMAATAKASASYTDIYQGTLTGRHGEGRARNT